MFLFISSIILINYSLFLWILLIVSNKFKSNEEKFIEDNLQMEYLRKYENKRKKQIIT